ncbi:hypothetical protein INT47_012273, partial [Mucor saturninus]
VESFKIYNNEKNLLEATYLRKFEEKLDKLLLSCTILTYTDGEGVCQSTRRMQTMTESNSEYGRRTDLLIKSTNSEECYDISSNEFKKRDVSTDVKLHQQSKNIRINAIYSLIPAIYSVVPAMYSLRTAIYSAVPAIRSHLNKRLVDLDKFRDSIITLFSWKEFTINVSNQVICTLGRKENEYALTDVAVDVFEEKSSTPPRSNVEFIPVLMPPPRSSKRTKP